jgi:hypothetical protein
MNFYYRPFYIKSHKNAIGQPEGVINNRREKEFSLLSCLFTLYIFGCLSLIISLPASHFCHLGVWNDLLFSLLNYVTLFSFLQSYIPQSLLGPLQILYIFIAVAHYTQQRNSFRLNSSLNYIVVRKFGISVGLNRTLKYAGIWNVHC